MYRKIKKLLTNRPSPVIHKGEFRLRKAQSGIPKNYVIIKIDPIRCFPKNHPSTQPKEITWNFVVHMSNLEFQAQIA